MLTCHPMFQLVNFFLHAKQNKINTKANNMDTENNMEATLVAFLNMLNCSPKKYTIEEVFKKVAHIDVDMERKQQLILDKMKPNLRQYMSYYKMLDEYRHQLCLYPIQIGEVVYVVPWKHDSTSIVSSLIMLSPPHRDALRKALVLIKKDSRNYPSNFSTSFQALLPKVYKGNEIHLENDYITPSDPLLDEVNASTMFYVLNQTFSKMQLYWWTTLYDVDFTYLTIQKILETKGKLKEGTSPSDRYVGTISKNRKVLMYQSGHFDYCNMDALGDDYALVCVVLQNRERFDKKTIRGKFTEKDLEQLAKEEKTSAKAIQFTWEVQAEEIPFVLLSADNMWRTVDRINSGIEKGEFELPVEDTDYYDNLVLEELREFELLQELLKTLKYL